MISAANARESAQGYHGRLLDNLRTTIESIIQSSALSGEMTASLFIGDYAVEAIKQELEDLGYNVQVVDKTMIISWEQ